MYNMFSESINNNYAHPLFSKAAGVGDTELFLHRSQMKWTTTYIDGIYYMADPQSISRLLHIQKQIDFQKRLVEDASSSDDERGNSFHSQTRKPERVEQSFATEMDNERQRINHIKVQDELQRQEDLYLKRIVDARNKKRDERKPTKNLIKFAPKDKDDIKSAKIKKMNSNHEIIIPEMQHSMMSQVAFPHKAEQIKPSKIEWSPIIHKNDSSLLKASPKLQIKRLQQNGGQSRKGIQINSIVNIRVEDGNLLQSGGAHQQKSLLESDAVMMKGGAEGEMRKDESFSILNLKSQQEHRIAQQMKCERAGDQFFFQLHSQIDQLQRNLEVRNDEPSPANQPPLHTPIPVQEKAPFKFTQSKAMMTTKAILKDLNKQLRQVGMIEPVEDSRITDERHSISAIRATDLVDENRDNHYEILAALKNEATPQRLGRELEVKNEVEIKIEPSSLRHSQTVIKELAQLTVAKAKGTNFRLISSLVSQQIAQAAPRGHPDNRPEQKQKLNDQISILKQVISELRVERLKYQTSSIDNNAAEEGGTVYSRMDPSSDRNQLSHRVSPSILHHFAESAVSEFHTNHRSLTEHKNSPGKIMKNISPSRRMSKIEEERKSQPKERQIKEEDYNDLAQQDEQQNSGSMRNESVRDETVRNESGKKESGGKGSGGKQEGQLVKMQEAESVKMKTGSEEASNKQGNVTRNIQMGQVNNSQSVWASNVKSKLVFNRSIAPNPSIKQDMESSMPRPLNKHNHSQPPKIHPQQHAALARKHESGVKKEMAAKFDSLQNKGSSVRVAQQAGDPKKRASKEGAYKTVDSKVSYHPDLNKIVFGNADGNLKAKIIEIEQAEKQKFQQQGMGDRRNSFHQSKSSKGFRLRRGSESSRHSRGNSSQKSEKAHQKVKQASLQDKSKVYVPALHEKNGSNFPNGRREAEAQASLSAVATEERGRAKDERERERERVKVQKRRLSFSLVQIPKIPNPPSPIINIQEMAQLMRQLSVAVGVQIGGEAQRMVMKKYKNCIMLDLPQSQSKLVWHYNGKLYIGEWNETEMLKSGEGIEYIPDKYYYRGQFLKGKRSGSGLMVQCSGIVYEGQWADGDKSGRGRYYDSSNRINYEGEWKNGKKEGFGYFSIDGQSTYQGTFVQNLKDGFGVESFHNQDSYKGEYAKGRFHGKGRYVWASGDTYEGEFYEGCKHGRGVWTSFIGEVYEGSYRLDKKTGSGKYRWANGCVFEGEFEADKKNGNGILWYPNGREVRGVWRDGKLVETFDQPTYDAEQPLSPKRSKVVEMTSEVRVENRQYRSSVDERRR